MNRYCSQSVASLIILSLASVACAEPRTSVTQHDITWTFDRPCEVGQFVTGDWWVVEPVTVTAVTPAPGPVESDTSDGVKSIYGAVAMVPDLRMRNGSMLIDKPSGRHGYDSRLKNFDPSLVQTFPLKLSAGQSLISSVSSTEARTPSLVTDLMWKSEKTVTTALRTAAVLTCVSSPPPDGAFRPAYAGGHGEWITVDQIQWEKLPKLQLPDTVPDFAQFARYFARPWLDHVDSWMFQHLGPSENQVNYGRELSRVSSMASLMLMLDVPNETKRPLLINYLQYAIDLRGLAEAGRNWHADGGHWNGRKWPMIFASIVLDRPALLPPAHTHFSEDQQTYYGQGASGQSALYQIVTHTGRRSPHEEKSPAEWDDQDKRAESYRVVCSVGWTGTALAAQLMGAKAAWNHDAFFDYADRWMSGSDPAAERKPLYKGRADPFVEAMWALHRPRVPAQPAGKTNLKWVWDDDTNGRWIENPKP